MKHLLNLCVLAVVLLMNPLWGCGDTESDFAYERQDMVDYAVGTWKGTFQLPSGEETGFELVIMERSMQAREQGLELREVKQPACGNRRFSQKLGAAFVRDAYACMSSSTLLVDARLTTEDGLYQEYSLTGEILVGGRTLERAIISMGFPDGGQIFTECDAGYQCAKGRFSVAGPDKPAEGQLISMQKQ